jgi:hypothetical protein
VAAVHPGPPRGKITIYGWSIGSWLCGWAPVRFCPTDDAGVLDVSAALLASVEGASWEAPGWLGALVAPSALVWILKIGTPCSACTSRGHAV